jgi:hypothetical protein
MRAFYPLLGFVLRSGQRLPNINRLIRQRHEIVPGRTPASAGM